MRLYKAKTIITSPFGERIHPILKVKHKHNGIDVALPCGTLLYSPAPGVVDVVGRDDVNGLYVIIDYGAFTLSLVHLSKVLVSEGERVKAGQRIALSGKTGRATGCHLHITLRRKPDREPVDPEPILKTLEWI